MPDEKIFEQLTDAQLDSVAGGNDKPEYGKETDVAEPTMLNWRLPGRSELNQIPVISVKR